MVRPIAQVFGLTGCLLVVLCTVPAQADPFFVTVFGRTYKVDPHYPSGELKGPKPQEAIKALPSEVAE